LAWLEGQQTQTKSHGGIPNVCLCDKAYIAGFVDGEGHIGFYKTKDGMTRLNISVVNTDIDVLKFIQKVLGLGIIQKRAIQPKRKQAYALRIRNCAEGLIFLEEISPYLKVKHMQAELVKEWLLSRSQKKHSNIITERDRQGRIKKTVRTDCYNQREAGIISAVLSMNRRGSNGME